MIENDVYLRMKNKNLCDFACKDSDALMLFDEKDDIRTRFFHDADRIIYSLSFTRYVDKTQVFTFTENDNVSKRITHVQYVSKIARTIGRALGLNEDLIEAAALGHDLGHPPFGHCGEKALNNLSIECGEGVFSHNVQSVMTLMNLENNGHGRNISVQVLDAILCHNGEFVCEKYEPVLKTKEDFFREYSECYCDINVSKRIRPMTLEGCVVRISDIVGYSGKDIEDAIRMGVISRDDIPEDISSVLGNTNSKIVNTLVLDIISNSYNKPYIKLSSNVFNALQKLIEFNYKRIYNVINARKEVQYYKEMYETLFKHYQNVIDNNVFSNDIYTVFLNGMSESYLNNTSNNRKIIDYIAGMTDDFFINRYNEISNIKVKR